jgi:hypothetical protein
MFSHTLRAAAPLLLLVSTSLSAQAHSPIEGQDLMSHIGVLASDAFEGRAPGTDGETRTTDYIVEQFRSRGLEPAAADGNWLQPVALVERSPGNHTLRWSADGRALPFEQDQILLLGKDESERIADARVVFAGHGARVPDRGIDQLSGADLRGAVVLILLEGPPSEGFPSLAVRRQQVMEAGAAAVIAIIGSVPWDQVRAAFAGQGTTQFESAAVAEVTGTMP